MEQVLSIITRHLSVAHKENMSIYVLVESYRRVSQEVLSALSSGWAQCPPLLASGKWGDCTEIWGSWDYGFNPVIESSELQMNNWAKRLVK